MALARQSAAADGVTNARFVVAEVKRRRSRAPFEPPRASSGSCSSTNRSPRSPMSGRTCGRADGYFVCWQTLADNPMLRGTDATAVLPPGPRPGGHDPSGRSHWWSTDTPAPSWRRRVVRRRTEPYRQNPTVEPEVLVDDDAYLRFLGVVDDQLAEARAACERHLAPLRRHDGLYDSPLAFQVFTARN